MPGWTVALEISGESVTIHVPFSATTTTNARLTLMALVKQTDAVPSLVNRFHATATFVWWAAATRRQGVSTNKRIATTAILARKTNAKNALERACTNQSNATTAIFAQPTPARVECACTNQSNATTAVTLARLAPATKIPGRARSQINA